MKSLYVGELGEKLEAAKGQVTKIDSAVGWVSATGLRAESGSHYNNLGHLFAGVGVGVRPGGAG